MVSMSVWSIPGRIQIQLRRFGYLSDTTGQVNVTQRRCHIRTRALPQGRRKHTTGPNRVCTSCCISGVMTSWWMRQRNNRSYASNAEHTSALILNTGHIQRCSRYTNVQRHDGWWKTADHDVREQFWLRYSGLMRTQNCYAMFGNSQHGLNQFVKPLYHPY